VGVVFVLAEPSTVRVLSGVRLVGNAIRNEGVDETIERPLAPEPPVLTGAEQEVINALSIIATAAQPPLKYFIGSPYPSSLP